LFWNTDVDNDLYGFQLSCDGEYRVRNCLTLSAKSRFGIFGNHIDQQQSIGGSNGHAIVNFAGPPYDGQDDKTSAPTKTMFPFLVN